MPFKDLREFIALLEERGELVRVSAEVDPELEITEIYDRVVKRGGPALLFERVRGSQMPVAINLFGSIQRMKWALGVEELESIGRRMAGALSTEVPHGTREKVRRLFELKEMAGYQPRVIRSAPCQQVVRQQGFSLTELPALKCWPGDGGRFITLPLVITRNPLTGKQNMGMYRLQVFDETSTGMHWHLHHDGAMNYREASRLGRPLEVAVALGGDPATIYASTAPVPRDTDELFFAGFLRGQAVEVVQAKTVDLLVPAHAEIILEGYCDPSQTRLEGPFGDHTGYYSEAGQYPIFHVTCVTHRDDPIYPTTVVGKPPMEDVFLGKATERIFLPLIQAQLPEIRDINLPVEGVFHNCAFISIHKQYPGHAQKVMQAVWSLGQMMFTKFVIVVDQEVDVQDCSAVLWKLFNNVDPGRDLTLVKGPLDILDHASNWPAYGHKLGIDATKKWPEEGYTRRWPPEVEMSEEIKRLVDGRWGEYGIG